MSPRYLILAILVFILTIAFPRYSLFTLLPAISGIYILHYICYKLHNISNRYTFIKRINKSLANVGSLTLEIYLLHYIILHYIRQSSSEFVHIGQNVCNTFLEFPMYITISIMTSILCIILVIAFKKCGLYKIIFPKKDLIDKLTIQFKRI